MHFGRLIVFILLVSLSSLPATVVAADPAQPNAAPAAGHSIHGEVFNEGPRQKAYLIGTTGNVSLAVTTRSAEAQQFFNQGLGQLHGFWYFEAERSFRQAAALDPDCAMHYWGMAMANRLNEGRGKKFCDEAVKRKAAASPREARWIDALADYFAPAPGNAPRDNHQRRQQFVRNLEAIIHDFPDEIEAKAFLGQMIWENANNGITITSHESVDALLREVHAVNPMHPAHHYRIHLWDGEKPQRALKSASLCGQSAPGIAHMWHMPGHTYTRVQRYADAAWQQEASARVDHAQMIRDRLVPDQIHNYAHNNDWLVENLSFIGRVRDAVDLAKNLTELPRHPRYNAPAGYGSGRMGRNRLFAILTQFELWEELIQLSQTPYLEPMDVEDDQLRRLRALGAAYLSTGKLVEGKAQITTLCQLREKVKAEQQTAGNAAEAKAREEKKPDDQVAKARTDAQNGFNGRIEAIDSALGELQGRWALAASDFAVAVGHFEKAGVSKEVLSRVSLQAGDAAKAEQQAREAVEQGRNRVFPLANQVEVLHHLGKTAEATEAFRQLQAISGSIDMAAPIFTRLTELAPKLGLPSDWRQPLIVPADAGERPALDTLGPFRWRPSSAPEWSLAEVRGNTISLGQFRGKAVVVIFYLGFGCLHCVEQINAFAPMHKEFADAGISLVAISNESAAALNAALVAREQSSAGALPIPLVPDAEAATFKAYRCFDDFENQPLHGTFLIDADGLIRWQDIGFEPFSDARYVLNESKRLLAIPIQR
jgi:peroxiredoxin